VDEEMINTVSGKNITIMADMTTMWAYSVEAMSVVEADC